MDRLPHISPVPPGFRPRPRVVYLPARPPQQLAREVEQLRAELARQEREIDRLVMDNHTLRLVNRALLNGELGGKSATLVELCILLQHKVARGLADEAGWVAIYSNELQDALQLGRTTIWRHLDTGEEMRLYERKTMELAERKPIANELGVITGTRPDLRTFYRLVGDPPPTLAQQLRTIADYRRDPAQPRHGGARVRCPLHPDAGTVTLVHKRCAECGRTLALRTRIENSHHECVEGAEAEAEEAVDEGAPV